MLDASTTAGYMAANMPDIPLTVLTNSIQVATELSSRDNIGDFYWRATGCPLLILCWTTGGAFSRNVSCGQTFLSCKGVHLESGSISESNELQARLKQKMVGTADQVILLADASKFGLRAFARVTGLDAVHMVITDQLLSEEELSLCSAFHLFIRKV